MLKAWLSMWKKTFCFTGKATRKEYWLALIMNVIAMYVAIVPYALLAKCITDNWMLVSAVYLIAVHLPVFSLYFRRARDAGWKMGTALYTAVTLPGIGALILGAISHCGSMGKGKSVILKLLMFSFALFFYGGVLGLALYGDPTAIPAMPIAGLLLAAGLLIGYGIVNWRQVLSFWIGANDDK